MAADRVEVAVGQELGARLVGGMCVFGDAPHVVVVEDLENLRQRL